MTLQLLLADDDDGDRRLLRRALRDAGIDVACTDANSVDQALELCARTPFDCAIVDYRLPGRSGLDCIGQLGSLQPYMGIIMVTGQGDETVATEAIKRGASDYLPKALVNPQTLERSLRNSMDRKTWQRKLDQQQEELRNFAHLLAHDLRAPSASIRNFADFIEHCVLTGDLSGIAGHCHRISRAAQRMDLLIQTLEQYTRLGEEVAFEPVCLSHAADAAKWNLESTIRERRAEIHCGPLPTVEGAASLLIQLLQNLIGNSLKYCVAPIPQIHIRARRDTPELWTIEVQDNGIGIAPENARKVFEPFVRLHNREQYQGTGLGLATCRKIVERHGGSIGVVPTGHPGTTIAFQLRDAAWHAAADTETAAPAQPVPAN